MYTALLEDASIFFAQGGHSGSWLAAKLGSIRVFETCMGLAPRAVLAPAPHCGVDHEVEFAPVLSALCTFGVDDGGTTIELLLQGAAIPPQHSCSRPHCTFILTLPSSSPCSYPHCDYPRSALTLTVPWSSLCLHLHSALILTLLSSSLCLGPHSALLITALSSSLCFQTWFTHITWDRCGSSVCKTSSERRSVSQRRHVATACFTACYASKYSSMLFYHCWFEFSAG